MFAPGTQLYGTNAKLLKNIEQQYRNGKLCLHIWRRNFSFCLEPLELFYSGATHNNIQIPN